MVLIRRCLYPYLDVTKKSPFLCGSSKLSSFLNKKSTTPNGIVLFYIGCFRILCCYFRSSAVWLISPPGARFAGRAVSVLGVNAFGVSPVPLLPQESRTSAPINLKWFRFKNNNLYEKGLYIIVAYSDLLYLFQ
jgi:hypothetical protein